MARLALAASVFLSLFLLSSAHRLRSDLPTESDALPVWTESSVPAAIRLPSDKSSSNAHESTPLSVTKTSGPFPTVDVDVDAVRGMPSVPIEVSLIPIGHGFPHPHPRGVFWRRLGHHCRHLHRGPHGGIPRGAVIPYGDDMIVPAEQVRGTGEEGRVFSGEEDHGRHLPLWLEQIPVEELAKQREMGLPREMRSFPRFRPHGNDEEGDGGLVKRFLDVLNRH